MSLGCSDCGFGPTMPSHLGQERSTWQILACRFMSASALKATDVLRCREMTLRANRRRRVTLFEREDTLPIVLHAQGDQ